MLGCSYTQADKLGQIKQLAQPGQCGQLQQLTKKSSGPTLARFFLAAGVPPLCSAQAMEGGTEGCAQSSWCSIAASSQHSTMPAQRSRSAHAVERKSECRRRCCPSRR